MREALVDVVLAIGSNVVETNSLRALARRSRQRYARLQAQLHELALGLWVEDAAAVALVADDQASAEFCE